MPRCPSLPNYLAFGAVVWLGAISIPNGNARATDAGQLPAQADEQLEQRVQQLIEQLGAPQFAARERAHERLRELGLVAFDALLDAQNDRDIEISLRARYLLRGMPVQWARDTDSQTVQSFMRDYGQLGREERITRMQSLAELRDFEGIEALCRICRFETDSVLSKQAALQALRQPLLDNTERGHEVAETIRTNVGASRRPAVRWLEAYAATLESPLDQLDTWERITRDELDAFAQSPAAAPREVVRDLLRWHVDLLRGLDRQDDALAKVRPVIDLVEADYRELGDVVDWALEREAWFVPEELAERFPSEYSGNAYLVYRLAEARRRQGREAAAEEAARQALALDPEDFRLHTRRGGFLQERQLYDWAEQEFRYVAQGGENHPDYALEAREVLSQMLFDLEREREAAEVLEGALAIIRQNPMALGGLYGEGELQSYVDYYQGVHFGKIGERAKQQEHLERAFENNPANIDIVIAMYRVKDADDEWRRKTREFLESSLGEARGSLQQLQQALDRTADPVDQGQIQRAIAQKNNELAWLISNTGGDFEEALRRSQESLRLQPGSYAFLDTLGRCYYALGKYELAVKYQREAVELAPYLQQMRRQLALFETAWRESRDQS